MKRHIILLTFAALAIVQSCGNSGEENGNVMEEKMEYAPQTNEVEVMTLERCDFNMQIVSNGKLCASARSALFFKESGTVEKVYVENGARVRKGDAIARLVDTDKRSALEQARTEYEKAGLNFLDELAGMGYYSTDTSDVPKDIMRLARIRSGYIGAGRSLEMAERSLEAMTLRAPFGGVVADLNVKEWERTGAEPVCTVIDCSSYDAVFTVMESEFRFIGRGQNVTVAPFGDRTHSFRGVITSINPTIDANGQIAVTAKVPGNTALIDGMNVNVTVEKSMGRQFVVPRSAVVMRDNMEVIFRYADGRAEWVYVNILNENSTSYAVEGNTDRGDELHEGDLVIVSGNLNLADESSVVLKK